MSFEAFQPILVPLLILKEAAAESAHDPYEFVLRETVPILASLSNSSHQVHHIPLIVTSGVQIILDVFVFFHGAKGRSGVDGADERSFLLECLIAAKDHEEDWPDDARQATDKTKDEVK